MKRSIAFLFACSIASLSTVAAAADIQPQPDPVGAFDYDAVAGVLFVPDATIPLTPADACSYPQMSGRDNAGLGCLGGLEAATDYTPPDNIETIREALRAALAPYNVLVTTTRPPEYVPYMMMLPGEATNDESFSYSCVGAIIDCDGVRRNDIGLTNGGTMNCTGPDAVTTALMAFGYMSGLENNDNAMDPMFYPPDFSMPVTAYQDMCSALVPTIDMKGMDNLPACVSNIHETHCDDMEDQVNSHLELEAVYGAGPWVEDTTAPVIENIADIEALEGMVFPVGTPVPLEATVTDDSGPVFARWSLLSASKDFLGFDMNGDGIVCKSHNDVCEVAYAGMPPYYQSDAGDYGAPELMNLPGGDYEITFEASDLTGNVSTVTVNITVEGGAADTTGGPADTTDGNDTNDTNDSSNDESSSGGGTGDGGSNADGGTDDGGGCSCSTDGDRRGAAFMLLGLVGLGLSRRRTRR